MRNKITAIITAVFMMVGMVVMASPASATTYYDCQTYTSRIAFEDYYLSIYPSMLAEASATVYWQTCLSSDGSANRNSADRVVFALKCDNPKWIQGLEFNLSDIEGMNLGNKFVPCDGTDRTTEGYDLSTPGFTYTRNEWSVAHVRRGTYFARAQFVPEVWKSHGPGKWGGRENLYVDFGKDF